MKKLISVMLAILLIVGAVPIAGIDFSDIFVPKASAVTVTGSCGENVSYRFDVGTGVVTISGTGPMSNYSGSISPFYNNTLIKTVIIDDGVTSIGDYAFYYCTGLTSITIPDSVTSISYAAFYGCSGIKELTMPCSAKIYNSEETFYNCTNIEKVTLTKGTGTMQTYGTSTLSSSSYTYYGYAPWYISRNSAKEIIIEDGVTNIGDYAFYNCTGLTNITIPDSVTSIGRDAFSGCTGLTSITIPDSVTSISYAAFAWCEGLTKVNINSIEAWCNINFSNSWANPLYYAHNLYLNNELVTDLVIPNSVTSIVSYTFYGCTGLTSITIPDSVTSIGDYAFCGCTGLKELTMPCSAKIYNSFYTFSGCFNIEKVTLTKGTGTMQTYGTSTSSSATYTYYEYTPWYISRRSIKEIVLEDGITNVGISAFRGCTGLTSITIPNSLTSIGGYAFYNCTGLTSITIPDSVTSIGNYAFDGCTNLKELTMPCSAKIYNSSYTFGGCTNIEKVTLTKGTGTMQNYASSSGYSDTYYPYTPWYISKNKLKEIVIEDGVTNIGDYAFRDCTGLTSITIPDSVTSIGEYAFAWCEGLTSITIPDSVTSIGGSAFGYCTGLTSITIPNSITIIPSYAFYGSGLTSITMSGSVKTISSHAFTGCNNLADVYYNGTLEQWEKTSVDIANNSNMPLLLATFHFLEGHEHSYKSTVVNPTCLEEGYTNYSCACGESYKDNYVDALGHNYGAWTVITSATCTEKGSEKHTCTRCTAFETREIEATGHSYTTTVTAPTCTAQGYTTHTCSKCEDTYKDSYTSIVAHSYKTTVTAPTCTAQGYTTHTCSVCNTSYKDTYTSALGHSYGEWVVIKPATETAKGSEKRTCSRCSSTETREIPKLTHTHSYTTSVTAPTCTAQGYTTHICSCGDSFVDTYVNALGHNYGSWTVVTPATCTAKGSEKHTCTRCTASETREIAATGHSYKTTVTAPTCIAQGYTTHTCSKCTNSYKDTYTSALGHNYGSWTTVTPATCTAKGSEKHTCTRCTAFETREIAATGHSYKTTVTAPTCTAQGYTTHTCSKCKDSYVDTYVNAKGHTDGKWEITKPATATAEGEKTLYCAECHAVIRTEVIQKIDPSKGKVHSVSAENIQLDYKSTGKLEPTIDADPGVKYTVSYESSNEKVATVDENGNVKALKRGDAKITVTVTDEFGNTVTDTCNVHVIYSNVQWIIIILLFGWIWY